MKEINVKAIAVECSTFSDLALNREKVDIDTLMKNYGGVITIMGFDIIETEKDRYPIVIFAEDNTKFFFGGLLLLKLFDKLIAESEGTPQEISEYMQKVGGLQVKLEKARTKGGNNLTKYTVL